ncbi:OmpA family protein [Lysobacter soyae]|jgi:outer membrane protein OmpA-like peptidoglycan-associated protein|uniref:OmpA family protein n=1 Tax=Lysobacter soyae TaxID=2764185 RepID=A0ABX8WS32_9GAMM|nr:OmpA family protein [Lysobacter sp. CJ11]
MNVLTKSAIAAAVAATMLAGCATYTGQTNDPNDPNRTRNGALIGASIGAVAGLLSGKDATERRQRAMVGAGIGGLAGAGIGAYQDRQEAELRRQTAGTGVDVQRDGDVIKLNLPDGVTFDFNKTEVKPQFYPALNNIASTIKEYNQTIVEINGHTDNVGSLAANQKVSEGRAQAVGNYLAGQGVQSVRMEMHGYNYQYPVADNTTDAGRAKNRRVEIRLIPVNNGA